ncbi:class 1 fructose-bisphosphatase [Helicobacter sp. MIT 21-1697]|uniref:class 1 fructose-bisphosphatase n=1 Tax=Helicobacter sp. MIT 21-1697 TaxID=2993733 RepID=UPI00224A60AB|nr:class 1 fructose-bisphosphatase [Helicobacter sp. MIT 21-1697]MCX2717873.1 class 1 fructose-bisphosphatase [Helicobacter sp. MIT 21-1697]
MSIIIDTLRESALHIDSLLKDTSTSYMQSINVSGDTQLEIDVKVDTFLSEKLLNIPCVKAICSEEQEEMLYSAHTNAPYIIAYDPLDGSSLIDSNLSIGTIFGIYNEELNAKNLIASGYIIYGPRLEMIIAQEQALHYRYNGSIWRNLGALQLNTKGKINAPGGTQKHWENKHKAMIESLFAQGYRLRYSGGMVPDLHQILVKGGGLFSYPATSDAPNGKLRKLFEVFPFAFVYEKAGGFAINGTQRILDLEVAHLHESTPCFFGSQSEINLVREVYE